MRKWKISGGEEGAGGRMARVPRYSHGTSRGLMAALMALERTCRHALGHNALINNLAVVCTLHRGGARLLSACLSALSEGTGKFNSRASTEERPYRWMIPRNYVSMIDCLALWHAWRWMSPPTIHPPPPVSPKAPHDTASLMHNIGIGDWVGGGYVWSQDPIWLHSQGMTWMQV